MFRACLFGLASVLGFVACSDPDACRPLEPSNYDPLTICASLDARLGAAHVVVEALESDLRSSGYTDCDIADCADVDFCGNDVPKKCLDLQDAMIAASDVPGQAPFVQVACADGCPADSKCGAYDFCVANDPN